MRNIFYYYFKGNESKKKNFFKTYSDAEDVEMLANQAAYDAWYYWDLKIKTGDVIIINDGKKNIGKCTLHVEYEPSISYKKVE